MPRITAIQLVLLALFTHTCLSQNLSRSLNNSAWQFRNTKESKWYPAKIPGTIHTDLLANKLIPDPFYASNEKQLQWIENESWEYSATFSLSKKDTAFSHVELNFDGLDTYANVYLNDSLILQANNMFREWNTDIKKWARKGINKLRIVFEPAVLKEKEAAKKIPYALPGDERVFSRKAPYQYGWDWGPRFVTCGIWKNVSLHFWNKATIREVFCKQQLLNDTVAKLLFEYDIETDGGIFFPVVYMPANKDTNTGMDCATCNYQFKKGRQKTTVNYTIRNPKRWWSNGLGDPHLYHFIVSIGKKSGPLDSLSMDIGLRTLELMQEKDAAGSSFYFKLNGVPVFMKGANYIPPDNFLPRLTPEKYEAIVKQAKEAHMNMLRVWGGGVYADDAFYKACDANGILVWQDFMFACAMYPGDEPFISNVKQEVIDNVNRLKNHPSLALWCGNNESDEGWKNWGWQKQYKYSKEDSAKIWNDYVHLFQNVIPKTLDSIAPGSVYVSSSPQIGWGHKESLQQGDSHYWGVWWGMEPFETYEKKVGRFMSEYGFQGMPDLSALQKTTPANELNLSSEAIKNHNKHPKGYETIQTYMERDYKVPKNFDNYVYVSQLLQARGMKTAIEAHRRAKPYCMGTLFWQLNDCWPVTSWSSVDYYGVPKAAYYQAKRSFRQVIVPVQEKNDSLFVNLISDVPLELKGVLKLRLMTFDGTVLRRDTIECTIAPNASAVFFRESLKKFYGKAELKNIFLHAVFENKGLNFTMIHLFSKPKDLQLTKPVITIDVISNEVIEVSSDVFAPGVYFYVPGMPEVTFDDNYFDLLPGAVRRIKFSAPAGKIPPKVLSKSLYDMNE